MNGNFTGNGTSTYVWNARNQLGSVSGGVSGSFVYDGLGRRKSKTIGATQTGFIYDGPNFVQELTGSTPIANLITGAVDEFFQRRDTANTRYPITNGIGSIIGLTDSLGVLQTQYSFEPYGKSAVTGSADANSQTFTGREDDGIGTLHYRARYFSPVTGRFLSEDPIGWLSRQTNNYAYVNENPIQISDPYGLFGPAFVPIAVLCHEAFFWTFGSAAVGVAFYGYGTALNHACASGNCGGDFGIFLYNAVNGPGFSSGPPPTGPFAWPGGNSVAVAFPGGR